VAAGRLGVNMRMYVDQLRRHASLRPGDLVQVRSQAEILATLDATGRLDGLPFMPEMLRHCGETQRVFKRADKTCDSIWNPGMRTMTDSVFLWGLRCDGGAHGGCQAGCLFFWKEAWLTPAASGTEAGGGPPTDGGSAPTITGVPGVTREDLEAATRVGSDPDADGYSCQATELGRATTPLPEAPWWDVRQYGGDVRSGNVGAAHVAIVMARLLASSIRYRTSRRRSRPRRGVDADATSRSLNLRPGDRVRVRSKDEIEATLDATRRLRGLSFNSEMALYCDKEFTVLRRVERIIHESTGKMLTLHDCIILDGATCRGDFHAFCPRNVYTYWREAWLRRVD
jgi:hypothetical protein